MVSKSRTALRLRRHEQTLDVWFPACYASQEEFNWCSVAPTIERNEPFGQKVERLCYLPATTYVWNAPVQLIARSRGEAELSVHNSLSTNGWRSSNLVNPFGESGVQTPRFDRRKAAGVVLRYLESIRVK
jgi:hypothetical protein